MSVVREIAGRVGEIPLPLNDIGALLVSPADLVLELIHED
jgi:hypothetical protein